MLLPIETNEIFTLGKVSVNILDDCIPITHLSTSSFFINFSHIFHLHKQNLLNYFDCLILFQLEYVQLNFLSMYLNKNLLHSVVPRKYIPRAKRLIHQLDLIQRIHHDDGSSVFPTKDIRFVMDFILSLILVFH